MRRAARTDVNQAEIVKCLRAAGCSVQSLATVGQGCPDLLVGAHGINFLLEVKNAKQAPSARKLTPYEELWHRQWRGLVAIVETPEQALAAVGIPLIGDVA